MCFYLSPPASGWRGASEMAVLLLLLGVVTTAAGLALIGAGAAFHEGTFDPEVLVPGTIAAVGGLLLIGMGLTVRELRRIERVLAMRPISRPGRAGETPAVSLPEARDTPARIPFPSKPKTGPSPQPASPGADAATAATEDAAFETLPAKFPSWARSESGRVVAGTDASQMLRPPAQAEEAVREQKDPAAIGRGANGAGPARAVAHLEAKPRLSGSPGRAKGRVFNSFWPVGPRRAVQTAAAAAAQIAVPMQPPAVAPASPGEAAHEASPAADESATAAEVSILKSGVIDGMAYTLYSDGSIEAQLPQGTLRFGSIAALRDHIESKS
jgi:hypothetical protein